MVLPSSNKKHLFFFDNRILDLMSMEETSVVSILYLFKEIGGADMIVGEETAEKINRRAVRFETGNSISFPRVAALYRSLHVNPNPDKKTQHRLEVVHVWTIRHLDTPQLQTFCREYNPLSVDLVGKENRANVRWATAANSA